MNYPVELLPWDSQLFGLRIAQVASDHLGCDEWQEICSWCKSNKIQCLYFRADLSDIESLGAAVAAGFVPVDVRITFEARSTPVPFSQTMLPFGDSGLIVRCAQPDDLQAVEHIARQMGHVSRFALDTRFPRGASGEMYAIWARKVYHAAHSAVFVAVSEGEICGFVACQVRGSVGKIELVGVHPDFRESGVGTAILTRAIQWFARCGCLTVNVVTQGRNVAAQRLYQKLGFRTESVFLVQHRWFDEPEGRIC